MIFIRNSCIVIFVIYSNKTYYIRNKAITRALCIHKRTCEGYTGSDRYLPDSAAF